MIRFINELGPTSTTTHQFSFYRAKQYPFEAQYFVVWKPVEDLTLQPYIIHDEKRLPQSHNGKIRIYPCGRSHYTMMRTVRRLLRQLRAEGVPTVVHLHSPTAGLIFHLSKVGISHVPTIYTMHNVYGRYSVRNRILTSMNMCLANRSTCVSEAGYYSLPQFLRRTVADKIITVPNGVNLDAVDSFLSSLPAGHNSAQRAEKSFRLANVARMNSAKNQSFLLHALSKLPRHLSLTFVGDGPERRTLERTVTHLNLADRVRFTGLLAREKVYREILDADLLVSSSRFEGLPIAVLEAMALAKPVLLSDIGPHREIARHNPVIPLLPANRIDAWIQAIRAAVDAAPQHLAEQGATNRKTVERHFSLKRMHEAYTEIYQDLWR